ncbi:hypothetical protein, partial [Escherichia coli]|uniref:hypothetical protein n=1 Tax=Escherichia coli TaxID=562 RepID=UPI001BC89EB7
MNKISAPRFLHLQIAENLPANLAAWAQSINDVQAWLVSFLIQHTSLTASKSFSEQLLKPLLGVSLDIENYCTLSSFFIISGFFGNV